MTDALWSAIYEDSSTGNNVSIVCKRLYAKQIVQELDLDNIDNPSSFNTYMRADKDENTIIREHHDFHKRFYLPLEEKMRKLPPMTPATAPTVFHPYMRAMPRLRPSSLPVTTRLRAGRVPPIKNAGGKMTRVERSSLTPVAPTPPRVPQPPSPR